MLWRKNKGVEYVTGTSHRATFVKQRHVLSKFKVGDWVIVNHASMLWQEEARARITDRMEDYTSADWTKPGTWALRTISGSILFNYPESDMRHESDLVALSREASE
jgi:hypothetical protein